MALVRNWGPMQYTRLAFTQPLLTTQHQRTLTQSHTTATQARQPHGCCALGRRESLTCACR